MDEVPYKEQVKRCADVLRAYAAKRSVGTRQSPEEIMKTVFQLYEAIQCIITRGHWQISSETLLPAQVQVTLEGITFGTERPSYQTCSNCHHATVDGIVVKSMPRTCPHPLCRTCFVMIRSWHCLGLNSMLAAAMIARSSGDSTATFTFESIVIEELKTIAAGVVTEPKWCAPMVRMVRAPILASEFRNGAARTAASAPYPVTCK